MGIFDKAKDLANQHPEQANQGIDKAGDLFDEKTGGQHSAMTDKVQDAAKSHFGQAPAGDAAPEQAAQAEPQQDEAQQDAAPETPEA